MVCILACADSRVPPEVIFDQGLGDMFVVRVAGNFADDDSQASLEYAVQHFDPPPAIIVVLGHERCGAIQGAAFSFDPKSMPKDMVEKFNKHPASENLKNLVKQLKPAIVRTRRRMQSEEEYVLRLEDAVRQNVKDNVTRLLKNPVIKKSGTFVIGARYDLDDGGVTWLTATPNETMLDSSSSPTPGAQFFNESYVWMQTDPERCFRINPKGGHVHIGIDAELFTSDPENLKWNDKSVDLYVSGSVEAAYYRGCGDDLTVSGTSLNTEIENLKKTLQDLEQRLQKLEK